MLTGLVSGTFREELGVSGTSGKMLGNIGFSNEAIGICGYVNWSGSSKIGTFCFFLINAVILFTSKLEIQT